MSIAMGNGTSRVKEVAKHTTSSNSQDGIHKALEHFGILASEKVFVSSDHHFNKVKEFHGIMDECTQEEPILWTTEGARHRAGFKVEELVEFLRAASPSEEIFNQSIQSLHKAIDKASDKVKQKSNAEMSLVGQVDALIDMLYFTYGSFVLMGVDPERLFEIVHQANMGKLFPDGKAHFDPVTHKILKPDDWEKIMHRSLLSKKNLNVKFKLINGIVKKMKNKKEERLVMPISLYLWIIMFFPYHEQQVSQLLHDARCIQMRNRPINVQRH